MTVLIIRCWLMIAYLDGLMACRPFRVLRETLRRYPVTLRFPKRYDTDTLCHAIDAACVLYFKPVLCLQRSCATTLLLRSEGWDARLMVGAQVMPPAFHAWVEVEGEAVNDKPYVRTLYQVLDVC